MADNVAYTAGAGTDIATDQVTADSSHIQIVKLAHSADGIKTLIPADASGLDVDVTGVAGNVTVVQATATNLKVDASDVAVPVTDNSGSLTVDAPVATPMFVRISDGAAAIDTLPVSGTITVQDGGGSITVDGTVAATQSGTWNVTTLTTITDDVNIADGGNSITVDGSVTVSGTATVTQGTAAAVAGSWPVKISDGTVSATITTVGGDECLDVNVVQSAADPAQVDKTAFTEGAGVVSVAGGVHNPTRVGAVGDNQAAAARITDQGDLHVNLRAEAGTEIGTSGAPLRVDPTGTTEQIVDITRISGTVVNAAAAGTIKVGITDEAGANFSASNTLPVDIINGGAVLSETNGAYVETTKLRKTPTPKYVSLVVSQTGAILWTPSGGKKFVIDTLILSATGAGVLTLFDETDTATTTLGKWTLVVGDQITIPYGGWPSATADNVLRYTTDGTAAAWAVVLGWDSD